VTTRTSSRSGLRQGRPGSCDGPDTEAGTPRRVAASTVKVSGDLDMATAPALRQRLESLLGEGVEDLVVDLRDVPFIDVAGLNVLLLIRSRLMLRGARLTVLRPCRSLKIMDVALGAELLPDR
jgi:anti-sigma B factor antagonist